MKLFSMLPLSLKVCVALFAILVILLVLIKRRKIILILILLDIGFGVWQGFTEYNRTNKDISNVKADIKIEATDLIKQYESNDSSANKKFLDKITEITGPVKEVSKDEAGYYTVILGDTTSMSSVRCSMDSVHQDDAAHLTAGSSVVVRGVCTGFNKDEMGLGSDVILNRCVIVQNKK